METTDKISCNIVVSLLQQHGVKHVVISPGSRNAPLIVALARCESIRKTVVIDERSAAFVALGIASVSDNPVALVCTSGTALLNYAPAVAEAYYRRIPLVVISADRPVEWIDQDDSQTLRQYEALANYVKHSYNIPSECSTETAGWYVNRMVNDALLTAVSGRKAPVHINIQLDEPLNRMIGYDTTRKERFIGIVNGMTRLPDETVGRLAACVSSAKKVLVIAGFLQPDSRLNQALISLSGSANITVMCESISNLTGERFVRCIDRTLSIMTDEERAVMRPDIVITLGGALVSRHIKQYLRKYRATEHWHVGISDTTIDCFRSLTMRVETEPADFMEQLASSVTCLTASDYAEKWLEINRRATLSHDEYVSNAPWSDMKAFSMILEAVPHNWNLELSNGTSVRYAQLFADLISCRNECNRGVSGIDGSTSTAIGASMAFDGVTLLVSGDMSAQYDIGALACRGISPRFKMIVMCNGGGGIFRFIGSTSSLPELEEYFVVKPNLPLRNLAEGYGFAYYDVSNERELAETLPGFMAESDRPAILAVNTPPETSARVLKEYFNRNKK